MNSAKQSLDIWRRDDDLVLIDISSFNIFLNMLSQGMYDRKGEMVHGC